ncbi:MAG: hypothetical protein KBS82_05920 [Oscillospiraceae bacterium]|nr:hypothetical protein [Candidatus Limimonas egerieequi]
MMHFFEKTKGSIAIFLILVLMPIYTCAYLAIDSARYSAAKAKIGGALELTSNAALADYDKTFKELYGIFVMSKSEKELTSNLVSFYSNMVDNVAENTINTRTELFESKYDADSAIYKPEVLEKYIRDFMKYRAPYNWTRGVSQKVMAFTQADKVSTVLDSSKSYYKSVSNAETKLEEIYKALDAITRLDENSDVIVALNNVSKMLPSLKSELSNSNEKAKTWSGSISSLDDGEVKQLLEGEYANSAGSLDSVAIDAFSKAINSDVEALKTYEKLSKEEKQDASLPNLTYSNSDFYIYLTSMYGNSSISSEDASTQKSAMDQVASTDITTFSSSASSAEITSLISNAIYSKICSDETQSIGLKGVSKLKDSAQNAFEMEYIANMFGCLTTNEYDENLMRSQFGSRPILKGEAEYILFGKNSISANVAACIDLIFAIRLIMNSIYVYTNASMRQSALAVASAIAGWSGIGIPVAQNAILVSWAMAESVLDTASLCKGETVPIYKTASTWALSLSSLPTTLAGGVSNYASKKIDDVFEMIEKASIDKTEDVRDATLSYMNQTGQGAVESITSMVVTPVEKAITSLTSGVNMHCTKQDIEATILNAVNSVNSNSSGVKTAKELFIKHCVPSLVDKVYSNLPNVFTSDKSLAQVASNEISNAISAAYSTLFSKVEETVNAITKSAEDKLSQTINSASDKAKEETISVIEEYSKSISKYVGETGDNSISTFSGMGMTYKDYVKVFSLIGLSSKESKSNMLKRCAVVMQIDCSSRSKSFNITKCYTGVRLCTSTGIGNRLIKTEEAYCY